MRNIEKQIFRPLIRGGKLKYLILTAIIEYSADGSGSHCQNHRLFYTAHDILTERECLLGFILQAGAHILYQELYCCGYIAIDRDEILSVDDPAYTTTLIVHESIYLTVLGHLRSITTQHGNYIESGRIYTGISVELLDRRS